MRLCVAILILGAASLAGRAASPPGIQIAPSSGPVIAGRVIADDTGHALANARVSVTPTGDRAPFVITDGEGRFTVATPSDRSRVVATKAGYLPGEATWRGGETVDIHLTRAAALAGRIVDTFGDPVVAAHIIIETVAAAGRNATSIKTTDSDDTGAYRLGGLPAGTFLVTTVTVGATAVAQDTGGAMAFNPDLTKTFYPGVATPADAQQIRLDAGDDRSGIDFVVPTDQSGGTGFGLFGGSSARLRLAAQGPTGSATAIIRGRVLSTDGHPLPRTQVRLFPGLEPFPMRAIRTDDDGRFEFVELPSGTFRAAAVKLGYAPANLDERVLPAIPELGAGPSIEVHDGDTRDGVEIRLVRLGAITGRVFDDVGDPVEGVSVQVLHLRYEAGRRRIVPADVPARLTDDRGQYRLYGIPSGRYIVSAAVGAVGSADRPGYTRTYFPAATDPSAAQFVSVGPAQEVGNVDVQLAQGRTARIGGTILNAEGDRTSAQIVRLKPTGPGVPVGAQIHADGSFTFPNVSPGAYVVQAGRARSNGWTEGEFGAIPLSANGTEMTDLVLRMSIGSSITGRFTFEPDDRTKLPVPSDVELSPVPIDVDLAPPQLATANIHPDWQFELAGISGLRRLQLTRTPRDWALKEIRVDGVDVADRPLPFGRRDQSLADVEVVLSARVTELRGVVVDQDDRPAPGAHIVAFSTDRDRWYATSRFVRHAVADAQGSFQLTGLPTGAYFASVVTRIPADGDDAWEDPESLDSLAVQGRVVPVTDGQTVSVVLRIPQR